MVWKYTLLFSRVIFVSGRVSHYSSCFGMRKLPANIILSFKTKEIFLWNISQAILYWKQWIKTLILEFTSWDYSCNPVMSKNQGLHHTTQLYLWYRNICLFRYIPKYIYIFGYEVFHSLPGIPWSQPKILWLGSRLTGTQASSWWFTGLTTRHHGDGFTGGSGRTKPSLTEVERWITLQQIWYDCFEISPCSLGNIFSFVFHFPAGHVKRRDVEMASFSGANFGYL